MKWAVWTVVAIALAMYAGSAFAQMEGKYAPAPHISTWLKGGPVDIHDEQHIYVVEFWATWCGPCRDVFPHLSSLQDQYGSQLVILAVAMEELSVLQPFVTSQGTNMDYTIANDYSGQTFDDYGVEWIPQAFVVGPHGTILWQGHSAYLDSPIADAIPTLYHFYTQPSGGWVEEGSPFTFRAEARGAVGTVHYAWTKDGVPIGSDSPVYAIPSVTLGHNGTYVCTATDSGGSKAVLTSKATTLTVFAQGTLPCCGPLGLMTMAMALAAWGRRWLAR